MTKNVYMLQIKNNLRNPCGVVANVMNWNIVVIEFEFQLILPRINMPSKIPKPKNKYTPSQNSIRTKHEFFCWLKIFNAVEIGN